MGRLVRPFFLRQNSPRYNLENTEPQEFSHGQVRKAHLRLLQSARRRTSSRLLRPHKYGCLDQCEHGPTVVVYPEAVWYGNVKTADVAEIVQSHIIGNRPVERLQIPDACLNTPSCEHRRRE